MDKGSFLAKIYPYVIAVLGLGALAIIGVQHGPIWNPTVLLLAAIAILAEWMVVRLPQGNSTTMSFIAVLLALLIRQDGMTTTWDQVVQAMEVIVAGSFLGYGLLRRQRPARIAFYVGQSALVGIGAGAAFVWASQNMQPWGMRTFHLPAVIVYILTYALLSTILVWPRNRVIITAVEERFPKTDPLVAFLLAPLPLLIYYLYSLRQFSFAALLLGLVPLFAVLAAFRLYINIDTAYDEVRTLYKISQGFVAALSQEETVQVVARVIASSLDQLVSCDQCLVYSYNPEANEFILVTEDESGQAPMTVLSREGVLGQTIYSVQGRIVDDITLEEGKSPAEGRWPRRTSLLVMPLLAESDLVGLLVLVRHRRPFNAENFRLIGILANQAGIVLKNAQLYERSQQLAETDRQLGLMNQTAFRQRAQHELGRIQVASRQAALLLADIDDFRVINNTYGHQIGDLVLEGVARILREFTANGNVVGRYGGEEFVALLPDANEDKAREMAERIRSAIEEHTFVTEQGVEVKATISVGIAVFPGDARDIAGLIKKADRAAYLAKRMGKNRVCLYEDRTAREVEG
ncbi:MAG: sensor domain-containing diguanylate cyclase [Anaerolineae bacterium]|jgi:diguanylate cyclase (GGDEF)-like protein|nr:sensor domain-containing diguanylate cyclase [Anaerolineae bacterium]MDH7472981.1 sensor domain-containing diguanylate cyclase [Anaerolineae bacterium]